jgi:NAD(P)-dependent dehydrogenase (short-subunit alcohol dehydrogenase family)
MQSQNRIVLVTGASRGIGRAIAVAFAANGDKVALTSRDENGLRQVEREIRNAGGKSVVAVADLADRTSPANLVKTVEGELGEIQILINNAALVSGYSPKPVVEFDDDYWEKSLMINLTAPYLLCKAVLPGMRRSHWGRIINIASINAKIGMFHGVAYGVTKHGLLGLTRSLALEVAKEGITVNSVCPGPTVTEANTMRLNYDSARLGKPFDDLEKSLTPMGRRVDPSEIAALTLFLASDAAKAITGQPYNVDCGMVMY